MELKGLAPQPRWARWSGASFSRRQIRCVFFTLPFCFVHRHDSDSNAFALQLLQGRGGGGLTMSPFLSPQISTDRFILLDSMQLRPLRLFTAEAGCVSVWRGGCRGLRGVPRGARDVLTAHHHRPPRPERPPRPGAQGEEGCQGDQHIPAHALPSWKDGGFAVQQSGGSGCWHGSFNEVAMVTVRSGRPPVGRPLTCCFWSTVRPSRPRRRRPRRHSRRC